jgi:hypothetical protein
MMNNSSKTLKMAKAVKVKAKDRAKALHQKETTLKAMAKDRVKANPL